MSNWSYSVYDGENPVQSGWHRSGYTRDNQKWVEDLIAARTVLERRVKALRKIIKELKKELGVGLLVGYAVDWLGLSLTC